MQVTVPNAVTVMEEVIVELEGAMSAFPRFASAHEGFAILAEEADELWDEVKSNPRKNLSRNSRMRSEAIQVAAMAIRFVIDVTDKETK